MRELKFKVLSIQGKLIGYERFVIGNGWRHMSVGDIEWQSGTFSNSPEHLKYIRCLFTGFKIGRNEVFEKDVLEVETSKDVKYSGEVFFDPEEAMYKINFPATFPLQNWLFVWIKTAKWKQPQQ